MSLISFFRSLTGCGQSGESAARPKSDKAEAVNHTTLFEDEFAGMSERGFAELINDTFGEYDKVRYGMPITKLKDFTDNPETQQNFKTEYGIEFDEYMLRLASGEQMGVSMTDGKFCSLLQ